jgi:hypothetical protein
LNIEKLWIGGFAAYAVRKASGFPAYSPLVLCEATPREWQGCALPIKKKHVAEGFYLSAQPSGKAARSNKFYVE